MREIDFRSFQWKARGDGDFATVDGIEAFRALVVRWLLTEPAEDPAGLTEEEVERRRLYRDAEDRRAPYGPPEGERLGACLPWDPTWGCGIKRYLGAPLVEATLSSVEARVRAGLPDLDGVERVDEVSVSALGATMTVFWRVQTRFGPISDSTAVRF